MFLENGFFCQNFLIGPNLSEILESTDGFPGKPIPTHCQGRPNLFSEEIRLDYESVSLRGADSGAEKIGTLLVSVTINRRV
ncbi:hypothetical protein Y981_01805 [Leptospirillum ferriphilum YSK]|uniref:Uncharacterized protein n=1 Tax=Leptospirillum ferriphilum YSK TaxID=1441628 RepID=A0A059XX07_9BACT|nr:hypothetical protein Y981_01805 [Leptospirillum ferriphilum YSK]